jgi:hypothetical protein
VICGAADRDKRKISEFTSETAAFSERDSVQSRSHFDEQFARFAKRDRVIFVRVCGTEKASAEFRGEFARRFFLRATARPACRVSAAPSP